MVNYPGLGLPLRHVAEDDSYPIGAHGNCDGVKSDLISIRELAMMNIMDRLTDKEDWQNKVFDDGIVSKWREEALAIPDKYFCDLAMRDKFSNWDKGGNLLLRDDSFFKENKREAYLQGIITTKTFDCCVKELRSKAKYYKTTGLIPTLDACSSVVKSDTLVSTELQKSIRQAFDTLKNDQVSDPDWHPQSNDMVQDLVHPSMYPFVYGRSKVLKEEVVGVRDAIEKWTGKGETCPKDDWVYNEDERHLYGVGSSRVPPEFWSNTYQWLPANVSFESDGKVRFTSYINNLHPQKYPQIYSTIEKLIATSLPAWDQCLTSVENFDDKIGAGRIKPRMTFPEDPDDDNNKNWIPSDPQECADQVVNWEELKNTRYEYDSEYDDETHSKWEFLREPVIPEISFEDIDYAPALENQLAKKFAKSGLQVIVKMASIELTPDKPEFPVGGWHVEGQMNEHICATALYYLDSENISTSNLSFRMQTSAYLNEEVEVGQDRYHWMEHIFGTQLGYDGPCLQNYGDVETRQGRLLAFPNVFQHQVSSFHLEDQTKPGHRRFIALWLVDPNQRIISTANVPPQQMNWWLDSILGITKEERENALSNLPAELVALINEKELSSKVPGMLPPELVDMVRTYLDTDGSMPMGLDEAKEHREKLMKARGAFVKRSEQGWQQHTYNFCEH